MMGETKCIFRLREKLPAVVESHAKEAFRLLLFKHGIMASLFFHGGDQKCIRPFLAKYDVSLGNITQHCTCTVTFFNIIEQQRLGIIDPLATVKTEMSLVVELHADADTKIRYLCNQPLTILQYIFTLIHMSVNKFF